LFHDPSSIREQCVSEKRNNQYINQRCLKKEKKPRARPFGPNTAISAGLKPSQNLDLIGKMTHGPAS
jgi:hypothetical protein